MTFLTSDRLFIQTGKVTLSLTLNTSFTNVALNQAADADDGRSARRYTLQRVVETFAQIVPRTLPTVRRSSIPPEKTKAAHVFQQKLIDSPGRFYEHTQL